MKAILMSIQPKWCELIAAGKKTVEVRKSAPKETAFKVYIYQTKKRWIYKLLPWLKERQARVIGEFICDKVEQYEANERGWYIYPQDEVYMWTDEIAGYGKGKTLCGLHISELKIYDEPKELSEFRQACKMFSKNVCGLRTLCGEQKGICDGTKNLTRPPQSWRYVEDLDNGYM